MTKQDDDLAALGEVDRKARVGRTVTQVGVPGALVIVGSWLAALAHLDLDPGAGKDIPANVTAALIVLVTAALAVRMNRAPGEDAEAGDSALATLVLVLIAAILIIVCIHLVNGDPSGL